MGSEAELESLIERLGDLDVEATIYAEKPWTERSVALVAVEPAEGGLPHEAAQAGLKYFLEVATAREFLEGWLPLQAQQPSRTAICQRLIRYAAYDA